MKTKEEIMEELENINSSIEAITQVMASIEQEEYRGARISLEGSKEALEWVLEIQKEN